MAKFTCDQKVSMVETDSGATEAFQMAFHSTLRRFGQV